jgi:ubiquitin-protein ligase
MSAFDQRRVEDLQKLRNLAEQSHSRVKITRIAGSPPNEIDIELHLKTAPSRAYPRAVQEMTRFTIVLPSRYPLVEPIVTISTPILHPNVYTSGRICLGMKWLPSLGLDLLVRRVGQIVIFDPTILNEQSPANREALNWYRDARRQHIAAFPTDTWTIGPSEPQKKMAWKNVSDEAAKKLVPCPGCGVKLSLPASKVGKVKCPRCEKVFEAAT